MSEDFCRHGCASIHVVIDLRTCVHCLLGKEQIFPHNDYIIPFFWVSYARLTLINGYYECLEHAH